MIIVHKAIQFPYQLSHLSSFSLVWVLVLVALLILPSWTIDSPIFIMRHFKYMHIVLISYILIRMENRARMNQMSS